jgi:hypothetical protein
LKSLDTYMHLCGFSIIQTQNIPSPQEILWCLFSISLLTSDPRNHRLILQVLEFHVNRIMECMSFSDWLLPCNIRL